MAARSLTLFALMAFTLTACLPEAPPGSGDDDLNNDPVRDTGGGGGGSDEDTGGNTGGTENNDPLPAGERVAVATLNVETLFDTECNSGQCGPDDFEQAPSQLSLDSKLTRLRRALGEMDADVIMLQEIETEELLDLATNELDGYPTKVFGETGGNASLDVAIVGRYPIIKVERHRSERIPLGAGTTTFARELLEVHMQGPGGRRVVAMCAHFISQRSDNDARREAEGRAAAKYAMEAYQANPNALVVLAGDLNDADDSPTLRNMYSEGMESANRGLSTDDYYTFVFQGERSALDHILYVPSERVALDPGSVESLHDSGRAGFGGSDHGAGRAEFILVD